MFKRGQKIVCIDISSLIGVNDVLEINKVYTCDGYRHNECCDVPVITLKEVMLPRAAICIKCLEIGSSHTPIGFRASRFIGLQHLFDLGHGVTEHERILKNRIDR